MIATITMPRLLYVGGGAIAEVTTALQRLGARRPLIVSDPTLGLSDHVTAVFAVPATVAVSDCV